MKTAIIFKVKISYYLMQLYRKINKIYAVNYC